MAMHTKLALRLLAVFVAVLTTITWVSEGYACTDYVPTTSDTTSCVTIAPLSNYVTLNSVGWGGTTGK